MKRTMIAAVVLGLLAMSGPAEAGCGKRVVKVKRGGCGLFHKRSSQAYGGSACGQSPMSQETCSGQQTAFAYSPPMAYSTAAPPPMTYAAPQAPVTPAPQVIVPQVIAPPGKSTPQEVQPPQMRVQPPGRAIEQR